MAIKKAHAATRGVSLIKRSGSKFYHVKYRDASGKQIMRSTETGDIKLATEIKNAIAEELLRAKFFLTPAIKDFTPEDAWKFYEAHQTTATERTLYYAESSWRQFWKHAAVPTLASLQPVDIMRVQKVLLAENKSPNYINKITTGAATVYSKLIRWGELNCANPFTAVDKLAKPKRTMKFRSWTEVERLIEHAKGMSQDLHLFCILCAYAGCRHGEAITAKWEHVDWAEGTFRICGTKTEGANAIIPLHDALRAALEPYRQDSGYMIAPQNEVRSSIRPNRRWNYQKSWELLVKATGFKGSPHTLRHSFATHLLELRYDPVLIVKLMRHTNLSMTSHYANLQAVVPTIEKF
jgi:integrase